MERKLGVRRLPGVNSINVYLLVVQPNHFHTIYLLRSHSWLGACDCIHRCNFVPAFPSFRPFRVNGWMCFQFLRNYSRWWIQVVECEWHPVTRNVHSASSAFALTLQNAHQGTTQNLGCHIFSFATCETPVSQWMKWSRTQFSRRSERLERKEVFDSEWNRNIQADIGRSLVMEYFVFNVCAKIAVACLTLYVCEPMYNNFTLKR